jgi:ATP adenylyltransferase/5',5'''-P-1,P-4-tetraphosphate phosphorylase II
MQDILSYTRGVGCLNNQKVTELFNEQVSNWELARSNFSGLKTVKTKTFPFDGFDIKVQFNPARIVSSGAKVDAKTIAERKCFLCSANLPVEQKGVNAGNYIVLVNPFPIFPVHFTIPCKEHIDQQIKPYFADMLELAKSMDDYCIFYNGPKCGASAPDHLHFQAGTKNFLPLITDYKKLKNTRAELISENQNAQLFSLNNYLRTVFCIESKNIVSAQLIFNSLYAQWQNENDVEPMMNIVCSYENDIWYTFVLPRANFRPWQFTAQANKQLLISPATVEMCGMFITPIEDHYNRITKDDIVSILDQSSI